MIKKLTMGSGRKPTEFLKAYGRPIRLGVLAERMKKGIAKQFNVSLKEVKQVWDK